MPGFYDRAFWTFFERPSYFEVATRLCEADDLPRRYWRERVGIPDSSPRDDKAGMEDLALALRAYFRQKRAGDMPAR
jgi:hypothetical protein